MAEYITKKKGKKKEEKKARPSIIYWTVRQPDITIERAFRTTTHPQSPDTHGHASPSGCRQKFALPPVH